MSQRYHCLICFLLSDVTSHNATNVETMSFAIYRPHRVCTVFEVLTQKKNLKNAVEQSLLSCLNEKNDLVVMPSGAVVQLPISNGGAG